jgi:hypothetical protein
MTDFFCPTDYSYDIPVSLRSDLRMPLRIVTALTKGDQGIGSGSGGFPPGRKAQTTEIRLFS